MPHPDKRKRRKATADPLFDEDYYTRKDKVAKAKKKKRQRKSHHQIGKQLQHLRKAKL